VATGAGGNALYIGATLRSAAPAGVSQADASSNAATAVLPHSQLLIDDLEWALSALRSGIRSRRIPVH
jgi:hypothetical protein